MHKIYMDIKRPKKSQSETLKFFMSFYSFKYILKNIFLDNAFKILVALFTGNYIDFMLSHWKGI